MYVIEIPKALAYLMVSYLFSIVVRCKHWSVKQIFICASWPAVTGKIMVGVWPFKQPVVCPLRSVGKVPSYVAYHFHYFSAISNFISMNSNKRKKSNKVYIKKKVLGHSVVNLCHNGDHLCQCSHFTLHMHDKVPVNFLRQRNVHLA